MFHKDNLIYNLNIVSILMRFYTIITTLAKSKKASFITHNLK